MRKLAITAATAIFAIAAGSVCAQQSRNYHLEIVDPAEQSAVFDNSGDVVVRVAAVPAPANGDQVELLVDGLPAAAPSGALEFHLSGLARGTHMLQARIIDSTGNVGSLSPSSAFSIPD